MPPRKKRVREATAEQTTPDVAAQKKKDAPGGPEATKEQTTPDVAATNGSGEAAIVLKLPLGPPPPTSFGLHLDMRLSADASNALRRVAIAYDQRQATLKNGRRIVGANDALRKILEEIADAVP